MAEFVPADPGGMDGEAECGKENVTANVFQCCVGSMKGSADSISHAWPSKLVPDFLTPQWNSTGTPYRRAYR